MPNTTVHHHWLITIFSSSLLAYYGLQFIIIGLLRSSVHHHWLFTIFSSSLLLAYYDLQFIIIGFLQSSPVHYYWLITIFSWSPLAYSNLLQFPPLQIPSVCLISFNPTLQPGSYNPHLTPVQLSLLLWKPKRWKIGFFCWPTWLEQFAWNALPLGFSFRSENCPQNSSVEILFLNCPFSQQYLIWFVRCSLFPFYVEYGALQFFIPSLVTCWYCVWSQKPRELKSLFHLSQISTPAWFWSDHRMYGGTLLLWTIQDEATVSIYYFSLYYGGGGGHCVEPLMPPTSPHLSH